MKVEQEKIMNEASKEGLSTLKKIMITHSKLRQYPELQRGLIGRIKGQNVSEGLIKISYRRLPVLDVVVDYYDYEGYYYM